MATSGKRTPDKSLPAPNPRLYLTTPPVGDGAALAALLVPALAAADVAAVLLHLDPAQNDERAAINAVKRVASAVQNAGAALVLDGWPQIVARSGADGAHITGVEALAAALPALRPDRIAGAGGLLSRHDAMVAGEAGADYVMFGEPDAEGGRPSIEAIAERLAWWSEVFEIPCVGFAQSQEDVETMARAGADFIALGAFIWEDPNTSAAKVRLAGRSCVR
ncbi:MAG: thiamine phosphate synthase [Variibacter sp.]